MHDSRSVKTKVKTDETVERDMQMTMYRELEGSQTLNKEMKRVTEYAGSNQRMLVKKKKTGVDGKNATRIRNNLTEVTDKTDRREDT